ncbi:MAG: sigma-70 family RNA polymerase sigma factor [Pseudomonadota bacterium]
MRYELDPANDDSPAAIGSGASSAEGSEYNTLLAGTHKAPLLQRLYQRYLPRLITNLHKTYGDGPPDPHDVAHQAFAKLAERGQLHDIGELEGFVWITARNIMYHEKRALQVRAAHANEASSGIYGAQADLVDPERVLNAKQQVDMVFATLRKMPERRRKIFLLHRVEGLTPEQAGRRCGVSRSSAVRHIAIATDLLTEALLNPQALADAGPEVL